jgi:pyruvate decarboxylase
MQCVLQKLIDELDVSRLGSAETRTMAPPPFTKAVMPSTISDQFVPQSYFWPRISDFLKPGDVVITETGTANFGILDTRLPPQTIAISQVLWGRLS